MGTHPWPLGPKGALSQPGQLFPGWGGRGQSQRGAAEGQLGLSQVRGIFQPSVLSCQALEPHVKPELGGDMVPPMKGVPKIKPWSWDSSAPASWCPCKGHQDLSRPWAALGAVGEGWILQGWVGRGLLQQLEEGSTLRSPPWHRRLKHRVPGR